MPKQDKSSTNVICNFEKIPDRLLRETIDDFLTVKQATYAEEYYFNRRTISEIADMFDIDKSTVSKTLIRARKRLETILKYALAK